MNDTHGLKETASGHRPLFLQSEKGMALLTVLVFSFIFLIGTMTFFTVAGYEAGQAEMRENSSRAFYLADGAIERCKDELLTDASWTAGFDSLALDGGHYSVDVDTVVFNGAPRTRFYAQGYYQRTKRDVEVIADIKAAAFGLAIYARSNINLSGNICLDGFAHANGEIYNEGRFRSDCPGTWDKGYPIDPPPAYTHPDSFPDATYYYIVANDGPGNADTLFVKDRNWNGGIGNTLQSYIKGVSSPDTPHPDMTWEYKLVSGAGVLDIKFQPANTLDQVTGPFPRVGTDFTVVLNFGGLDSYMNHSRTDLTFQETGNFIIQSTIINTRYLSSAGTSTTDRLTSTNWVGGHILTKTKTVFQPLYCIAFLAQSISGNAQVDIGTSASPALSYVMQSGDFSQGQWTIYGSLVSLGDIDVGGGVNLTFDRNFIDCLPQSISVNWPEGTSGVMEILQWREPPPRAS